MIAVISWWNVLSRGYAPAELSRILINEIEQDWGSVDGLAAKFWLEQPEHGLWGAVMIWADRRSLDRASGDNPAARLLGQPDERTMFVVPAAFCRTGLAGFFRTLPANAYRGAAE